MIGVDIVKISRMEKVSDAFLTRTFTQAEREYCASRKSFAESLAGIFAAKEAAVKAIKHGFGNGIMPADIEIAYDECGAPVLAFYGGAARLFEGKTADVSISHDGEYAIAVVELI